METMHPLSNRSVYEGEQRVEGFLSDEVYSLLMYINSGVLTTAISVVGIGANVANLATFSQMGFKDTINISLTVLAATDFVSLICLLWTSICYIPSFHGLLSDTIDVAEVDFITASMAKAYLTIVAGFITSLVAVERCLCVLMPLRVKVIFTKGRLIPALVATFILVWLPFLPVCFTTRLDWVYKPGKNRTIISMVRRADLHHIDAIGAGLGVGMYMSTYLVVLVSTIIIVQKLASQSAWRANRTSENVQKTTGSRMEEESKTGKKATVLSGKDRRATKTVTFIASMYIVCLFPGVVTQLLMSLVAEFNKGMRYSNIYDVIWSICYIGEGICSSANILVYLKTSAKYKEAFMSFFRLK